MRNADLFPEHFIYTLPTPSSYIGADKIFNEDKEYYRNLRFITDVEEPDYTSDEYRTDLHENIEELNSGTFYSSQKRMEWSLAKFAEGVHLLLLSGKCYSRFKRTCL